MKTVAFVHDIMARWFGQLPGPQTLPQEPARDSKSSWGPDFVCWCRSRLLQTMTNLRCADVVLAVAAAVAGTTRDLSLPVAAVVVALADACVHVRRHHVCALPISSPRSASTTLVCGVHQSLRVMNRW
jgi:hypothetical protein